MFVQFSDFFYILSDMWEASGMSLSDFLQEILNRWLNILFVLAGLLERRP